jgi:S1-C subfamily serine protease
MPSAGSVPPSPTPLRTPSVDGDELTPDERVNVRVYENVNRGVVHINTRGVQVDQFRMFEVPSEGEGSGIVIDRQGHILTNFHVVEDANEIQVTLFDNNTYEADPVGTDPATDIAVLKIDAPADTLYPVSFGDSSRLLVGQRAYAIGNPFGLDRTLSTGIISSLNRSLPARGTSRSIKQIIQVDMAINPGNSGGPLLDSRGRMIGMNTAIATKTGESAGVGFAIPVNTISRIVPELMRDGRVVRADIGIAQVYTTDKGLRVLSLVPDGPAEKAGLQGVKVVTQRKQNGMYVSVRRYIDRSSGDVIVAIDGQPVRSVDDLLTEVEAKKPGDEVTVAVLRDGKRTDVPVRLGSSD